MGTPTEEMWPWMKGFSELFPKWEPKDLSKECPLLDPNGINLLRVSIYFIIINYRSKL